MTDDPILYETPAQNIARIVLNRPESRNAQDTGLLYALNAAFDRAARDDSVKVIVLMSDGDTTMGRSNDEAASAARAAGIPVHTIAFGTDAGTIQDPFGGGTIPVPVNEAALEQLAHQTEGRALTAQTADQLADVYEDLGRSVTVEREEVEVADLFAGAAMAMLVLAGVGSLRWSGRLP